MAVLMPMTSPRMLSSGPPLLPGLMAASVCRKCWNCWWGRRDIALFGADDAGRDGGLEPERGTDRHAPVAHLDGVGVADFGRDHVALAFHADHREIGRGIHADYLGVVFGGIVR